MMVILQIEDTVIYTLSFTAKTYLFESMNNQGVIKNLKQI